MIVLLTGSYYMVLNCTPPAPLCQSHMHTDLLGVLMGILEKTKSKTTVVHYGMRDMSVGLNQEAAGLLPSGPLHSSVVALNV